MAVRIPSKKKRKTPVSKITGLWIILPVLFILLIFSIIFWKAGSRLIESDNFDEIEWAVVLAGQSSDCERTDAAAELFKENKIKHILISSIPFIKSSYFGEHYIEDLLKQKIPRKAIFELKHFSQSTIEEAIPVIRQFRMLGIDTALIITSDFHSRRAKRIFNKLSQGRPHFMVYPAEFGSYNQHSWWSSRESRKVFVLEFMKTINSKIEMFNSSLREQIEVPASELLIEPEKNIPEKYLQAADEEDFFDEEEIEPEEELDPDENLEEKITSADTASKDNAKNPDSVKNKAGK